MTTKERTEERIHQEMTRCTHFNGLMNRVCKAGVVYVDLMGGARPGWATSLPCLSQGGVNCATAQYPTREEAVATIERSDAALADMLKKMAAKECQYCGKTYEGRQVGPCVYCEHCNGRLYQGTVSR